MANKKYVTAPLSHDTKNLAYGLLDFFRQVTSYLNELMTMKRNIPSYANNAAAVTAGLSAGDWYYNTTDGCVSIVQ